MEQQESRFNDKTNLREFCSSFHKWTSNERSERLIQMGALTSEDLQVLNKEGALSHELAAQFIENSIGSFALPLGLALNFNIDSIDYIIPMAIEETSVIAGVSKTAKWIRNSDGEISTKSLGYLGVGQIQFPFVNDLNFIHDVITTHETSLIELANREIAGGIFARGGGVKKIFARGIKRPDNHHMAIIHLLIDTCDAMGANIINQTCEFLKPIIEDYLQERAGICILSNLTDDKIAQANIVIKKIDAQLGADIEEASLFAQLDPYRAATNNKGIFNGIDAFLIATGNDWRAVEAGGHAYAARHGQYSSLSKWTMNNGHLHGQLELPMAVGIVGGITSLHPIAKICLRMLRVKSSAELGRIAAAVGLVQNLAALTALVTGGITKGHMRLHIPNLAIAAGATKEELPIVQEMLKERLKIRKTVTGRDAQEILNQIRNVII